MMLTKHAPPSVSARVRPSGDRLSISPTAGTAVSATLFDEARRINSNPDAYRDGPNDIDALGRQHRRESRTL